MGKHRGRGDPSPAESDRSAHNPNDQALAQAENEARQIFARFDKDGSGSLDDLELEVALEELGVDPRDAEVS